METEKKWEEMTPKEKRNFRFKRWLEAPGVKFVNENKKGMQACPKAAACIPRFCFLM